MICPRACCLPVCLTHDLQRKLLMFLQVPQPASLGSAFPPKPQSTPKNSPLPMQTEPTSYCALWSCIVLPLVLPPSGKVYDVWLAAAKLLLTLRDRPYDRERGPDLKSEA